MSPDESYIRIRIAEEGDVLNAVLQIGELALKVGFHAAQKSMIATAASELGQNILKYAEKGELIVRFVRAGHTQGLEIVASDRGPGIPNIGDALKDHFSTGGTLGLGLPGVKRMMDEMRIESEPGKGTRVTIRKWL